MKAIETALEKQVKNFVLMGESGSGKSEIALNLAVALSQKTNQRVDFYDLDMTKPLFRSRDLKTAMSPQGVDVHYQEQFMDSPAISGGVRAKLKATEGITVVDVGGNNVGARVLGGYAHTLNNENTLIYYVINCYRPWSKNLEEIDKTLSEILAVTHIEPERIKFIGNPNFGWETTLEEFVGGQRLTEDVLPKQIHIDFFCAKQDLYDKLSEEERERIFPLKLHLGLE